MTDSEFLSLKEAAAYLNVKYKTVYRLVREGKLPAAKVGGVYRIRRQDLEAFLQRQTVTPAATAFPRCGVCGRIMASELSVGGHCQAPGCDTPICFACWQWEHHRLCAVHQATAPTLEPSAAREEAAALLRCGVCFRLLSGPQATGGRCQAPGCAAWICPDCWRKPDGHYCREHAPTREQKLAEARQQLAAGRIPCLVTDLEARKREVNFLNRFNYKVRRVGSIRHPLTGRALRIADWDAYHTAGDETERLLELLGVGYLERDVLARTPLNEWSRYLVPPSGDSPALIFEARVFSHLDAHARQGFDTRPATVEDLLPLLQAWSEEATRRRGAYVVGLASTTGWDAAARAYIQGREGAQGFFHEWLLPLLVDLESGEVIYNRSDERVAPLASLFAPQLREELVEATARRVEEWMADRVLSSLTAQEVTTTLGVPEDVVVQAFQRLARSHRYLVEDIKDLGVTLVRK